MTADDHGWNPGYYAELDALLDGHPWYEARNRAILTLIRRASPGGTLPERVLDLGCGSGFVSAWLEKFGILCVGADVYPEALGVAGHRIHGPRVLIGGGSLPFAETFDLVVLADVIEHADDDVALLREARTTLHPGGKVLVTAPAFPWLWGPVDDAAHHRRRYTAGTLRTALTAAGLRPRMLSYLFLPLVLPIFIRRFTTTPGSGADVLCACSTPPGGATAALLRRLLAIEEWWLRYGSIPLGSSLIAVAERI